MLILDGHESCLDIDCLEAARTFFCCRATAPLSCSRWTSGMVLIVSSYCVMLFVPVLSSLTCLPAGRLILSQHGKTSSRLELSKCEQRLNMCAVLAALRPILPRG